MLNDILHEVRNDYNGYAERGLMIVLLFMATMVILPFYVPMYIIGRLVTPLFSYKVVKR